MISSVSESKSANAITIKYWELTQDVHTFKWSEHEIT